MTYIIENANILKDSELVKTSLLIKEKKITYISKNFNRYSFMKMNAESYIMTPTFVLFDSLKVLLDSSFQQKKDYFLENFIKQGSTTLLTFASIRYENELMTKLREIKRELLNSPIDYLIGVKVPLNLLNPGFIRKCKKEKIPAIFIELEKDHHLSAIPWGWIREAMFPFNSPLIPFIVEADSKYHKKILQEWKTIMESEKIPHLPTMLTERIPLSLNVIGKLGIYPQKACILQGGEVSYNLFKINRELKHMNINSLYQEHRDKLIVTVHKGSVIRAGDGGVIFRSGFGEHVKVTLPSFFQIEG
ncbi:hypothetical protein [Pseudoneobacillus sp. C159]